MPRVVTESIEFFHSDPTQPRKYFDEEELRRLCDDLRRRGQLLPVIAKENGLLIDGERRWRSAKLGALKTLDAILVPESVTPAEVRQINLVTSLHKADLKPFEVYLGLLQLKKELIGVTDKELAEKISRSPATVSEIMSLERCPPEVKDAAAKGLIGPTDWREMARSDRPLELLAARLNNVPRHEIRRMKRQVNGEQESVKVERVKFAVPNRKADLTIAGQDISLSSAIELVQDWLKEAKKAAEQGWSIKALVKVLKDKAAGANHG